MSLFAPFEQALLTVIGMAAVCAVFLVIVIALPEWMTTAIMLLWTLFLSVACIAAGLYLPFPINLVLFAGAGVAIWWHVRELRELLRPPAAPVVSAPVTVPPRSKHEIRLLRREIGIDCVILVIMLTVGSAQAIDGDLRLALVATAFAALIANGFIFVRLKDRAAAAAAASPAGAP